MKNSLIAVLTIFNGFFTSLGFGWVGLINGIFGGLVYCVYKQIGWKPGIRVVFIGAVISAYLSPLIAKKIDPAYVGFISFGVGMSGLALVEVIIGAISDKVRKMVE